MCRIIGVADLATAVKSAIATINAAPITVGFVASGATAQTPVGVRAAAPRQRALARGHVVVGQVSPQH
jgi:hypothetical protein